jgi:solute carrier family 25 uncoupling protein 27
MLSLTSTARRVVETEGFFSLFRGCTIAIVRQWINAGVSISLYPSVRRSLLSASEDSTTAPLWKRTAAGAVTGVVAQALAQPTDVIKVRLQADGRLRLSGGAARYTGVAHAFREVVRTDGVRGLYVAMGSSVWRAGIINAVGISSYDHTKQSAVRAFGDNLSSHTIAALVCGAVTAVVSCPLDVVKTRVINNPTLYKGPNDAFIKLVRNEGILSMFKGLVPTYQRQALWNGIFWIVFEQLQKLTGGERI